MSKAQASCDLQNLLSSAIGHHVDLSARKLPTREPQKREIIKLEKRQIDRITVAFVDSPIFHIKY